MNFDRISGTVNFTAEGNGFRIGDVADLFAPFPGERRGTDLPLLAFNQIDPDLCQMTTAALGCASARMGADQHQGVFHKGGCALGTPAVSLLYRLERRLLDSINDLPGAFGRRTHGHR